MAAPHRIDVHHHVTPPSLRTEKMRAGAGGGPTYAWTIEKTLEDMEKGDVRGVVISMPYPVDIWPNPKDTLGITREWNDYVAGLVSGHPGRFGQFTMLPILDIEGSLREIEYSYDVLKADGINLMTNIGDKWLGDPHYAPVFEELNRRGTILYTHPVAPNCCRDLLPELNDSVIEYGADTSRAIAKMIYGGSAARYPKMRVIFSHAGGSLPYSAFRFIRHSGRLGPELKANMPDGFVAMLNKFHYDTANTSNRYAMGSFRELIAISQLMFGTDFPFGNAAHDAKSLRDCGFGDAELRAIECENAYRLWPRLRTAS